MALVTLGLGSILCAVPFGSIGAHADSTLALPVLPTHAFYPSGVKVKDQSRVTNEQMDCNWNAVCGAGVTVFHQATQESLGRVSGWMQRGTYKKKNKRMTFVTWGSTYGAISSSNSDGSAAGSQAAAADFASVVSDGTSKSVTCPAFPVPASQVQCWTMHGDGAPGNPKSDHYWIMVWWSGTAEVEMAAYANTRYAVVKKTFDTIAAETMGASALPAATPVATVSAHQPQAG